MIRTHRCRHWSRLPNQRTPPNPPVQARERRGYADVGLRPFRCRSECDVEKANGKRAYTASSAPNRLPNRLNDYSRIVILEIIDTSKQIIGTPGRHIGQPGHMFPTQILNALAPDGQGRIQAHPHAMGQVFLSQSHCFSGRSNRPVYPIFGWG